MDDPEKALSRARTWPPTLLYSIICPDRTESSTLPRRAAQDLRAFGYFVRQRFLTAQTPGLVSVKVLLDPQWHQILH